MRDTTQTCTVADQVRHEQRGAVALSRAQQDVSHMILICPFSARRFLPLESEAGFISGGYHVSVYIPPCLSCSTFGSSSLPTTLLVSFWSPYLLHSHRLLLGSCRFCFLYLIKVLLPSAGKQPRNPTRFSGSLNQVAWRSQ